MTEPVKANRLLIGAAVLALGVVAGGYLLGDGLRRARVADRSVTMRGLAERDVTANRATWSLNFSASGTDAAQVQAEIERDTRTIGAFFQRAGFPANAVADRGGSINSFYDNNRQSNVVTINRRLQFRTADVMKAQRAHARQFDLIRGGVELQEGSNMVYSFTQLNAIKPELIGESIKDARRAAERFAQDSGAEVGAIRSATQGYFSIGARDGDADTGEGGGAGDSPLQKVRVVSTIDFYLR